MSNKNKGWSGNMSGTSDVKTTQLVSAGATGTAGSANSTGYASSYDSLLNCPFCQQAPSNVSVRLHRIIGCINSVCDFKLTATTYYEWNDAIRLILKASPALQPKVATRPRLVVRLAQVNDNKTLRLQVVEQNLLGLPFNNYVRVKGISHLLYSGDAPALGPDGANVRGTNTSKDDEIVEVTFKDALEASALCDELTLAIQAFNDGDEKVILPFESKK